jgi:hypothetical protein
MPTRLQRQLLSSQSSVLGGESCASLNERRKAASSVVASVGFAATGAQHEASRFGRESHWLCLTNSENKLYHTLSSASQEVDL